MPKVTYFELMGPDGVHLNDFYSTLFGWNAKPMEGFDEYHVLDPAESGIDGAIGKGNEHMPAYAAIYVSVDDVDAYLASAAKNGGTITVPKQVIPDVVTFAMFTDPAGNLVGLFEG
jgi:predicted enzyme related to lactoylglutathione lyase